MSKKIVIAEYISTGINYVYDAISRGYEPVVIDCPYVGKEEIINVKALTNDFSGHDGGDAIMVREFVDLLEGAAMSTTLTSIDRSVESHLVCLAAEKSRVNHGAVVEL